MKYVFSNVTECRSKTMSAIKSTNTKIEIVLRKELFRQGYRYRINYNKLIGKPDIAFINKKIAIFCDSEFWHGKNWCEKKKRIKNNSSYWIPKIERNIERDKLVTKQLERMGWHVLRFWESEIKNNLNYCIQKVVSLLE